MAISVGQVKVELFARIEGVNHDFEVGLMTVDVPVKIVGVEAIAFVANSVAQVCPGRLALCGVPCGCRGLNESHYPERVD